jgi:tetratricopeptide (TPR) repeat protein
MQPPPSAVVLALLLLAPLSLGGCSLGFGLGGRGDRAASAGGTGPAARERAAAGPSAAELQACADGRGDPVAAIAACTQLLDRLDLDPRQRPDLMRARAFAHLRQGAPDAAIRGFDEALAARPNDAASFAGRGLAFDRLGDPAQAIEDYSVALTFAPDDSATLLNRARAHARQGTTDRALEDFDA